MNSPRQVSESLQEYARGIAGGLIFSLPLLYTMEMWWAGFTLTPARLLFGLGATFVLLLGYNSFAGLRHDATFVEVLVDSIEELGLGILLSTAILALLGRISFDLSLAEIIGKIVIETCVVAIGVSVGTAQLGTAQLGTAQNDTPQDEPESQNDEPNFVGQLVIAACGATMFAFNVAPTEEIIIMAIEIAWWKLLLLVASSLGLAAMVLFFSDFRSSREFSRAENSSSILRMTIITYAIALAMSAAILWFFNRFENASIGEMAAQVVILGFAASLGASAGRLLLQSQ